jgi:hypothetical protein
MLAGILVVGFIVVLYIASYALNKRTEAPIDLKNIDVQKCGACNNFSCTIKQQTAEEN